MSAFAEQPLLASSATDSIGQHMSRWERAMQARVGWTREAWIDLRFECGKTFSPEELEILHAQGRDPSNYNLIRPAIELVCGIEEQTRQDLRVLPRTSRTVDTAEALTKLAKYVDDQNLAAYQRSRAFGDAAKVGIGWMECGYNEDITQEQILIRRVNPFDIWLDPTCKEPDLSDALDIFRARWCYPELLSLRYPQLKGEIPLSGVDGYDPLSHTADYTNLHGDRPPIDLFNGGNGGGPEFGPGHGQIYGFGPGSYTQDTAIIPIDRYQGLALAVERWYRVDEISLFAKFRNGVVLEATPENHAVIARAIVAGEAKLYRNLARRIRMAIFVGDQLVEDIASPYPHGRFPFVQIPAYEDEDGIPMGLVRSFRDPQKEYNARRTHLTRAAISNQWAYEEGAFADEDDALSELRRHDGSIRVNPNMLDKFIRLNESVVTETDFELLQTAAKQIGDQSGLTLELMGQASNAESGKAIQMRQQQGQANIFTLFTARNLAQIELGRMTVALIQDCYTEEQEIRITGGNQGVKFLTVNKLDPTQGVKLNDITQGVYDVTMTQQPQSPTERAMKAQNLAQFLQSQDPRLAMLFAGELADLNDLPSDVVDQIKEWTQAQLHAQPPAPPKKAPMEQINYKDAPEDIRRQMEQQAGMQPSNIPPGTPGNPRDLRKQPLGTVPITDPHGPPSPQPPGPMPGGSALPPGVAPPPSG